MPRDPSGSYSLPTGTIVNSGDTVLPSQHNPAFNDVAQALTNSLSRDGNGAMRAPLAMGGNRITDLANGAQDGDAATIRQLFALSVPIGVILDYAGSGAPAGFLLCYGQAVSRTEYASLFANIGTVYGVGDGSTTFNVPDLRGNVVAGKGDMGGTAANRLTIDTIAAGGGPNALGGYGGSNRITLTTDQIPSHAHAGTTNSGGSHNHAYGNAQRVQVGPDNGVAYDAQNAGAFATSSSGAHTHTFSTDSAGGGGAHNNVQPTFILNKIIRAL